MPGAELPNASNAPRAGPILGLEVAESDADRPREVIIVGRRRP
jgi:hypothetical protein